MGDTFVLAGCGKMAYKARYQPLEVYAGDGWHVLDPSDTVLPEGISGNTGVVIPHDEPINLTFDDLL